jgi:hypothetical protein
MESYIDLNDLDSKCDELKEKINQYSHLQKEISLNASEKLSLNPVDVSILKQKLIVKLLT